MRELAAWSLCCRSCTTRFRAQKQRSTPAPAALPPPPPDRRREGLLFRRAQTLASGVGGTAEEADCKARCASSGCLGGGLLLGALPSTELRLCTMPRQQITTNT